jgi:hypothetical protein
MTILDDFRHKNLGGIIVNAWRFIKPQVQGGYEA